MGSEMCIRDRCGSGSASSSWLLLGCFFRRGLLNFCLTIVSSSVLFLPLFLPRLEIDVVTSSAPLTSFAITSGSVCSGVASRGHLLGRGGAIVGLGGGASSVVLF